MTPTPVITFSGVAKRFRRGRENVDALLDVELSVAQGEFVSVIGPSGCGKSTLLRLVGGLLEPDTGTVEVFGRSPAQARAAKLFGLVPQTPALLPWRTARENISLLGEVNRTAASHDHVPADPEALIDAVGLRGFERARPAELSGGMQQRVALARAFALGAPVLLMDEPFAALDEFTREEMRFLLADVWAKVGGPARTVLFVTHAIEEAVLLADRVVVLSRRPGRVVADIAIDLPHPRQGDLTEGTVLPVQVRTVRAALRAAATNGRHPALTTPPR